MAFTELQDLDATNTVSLGGTNRKTGKSNPTRVEGYYIGSKNTVSKKSRTGFAKLHILQTPDGNLGVWGKTDLDRKMTNVEPGTMIRVTQNGMLSTPNGEMYKFKVEVDKDNKIDVQLPSENQVDAGSGTPEHEEYYSQDTEGEEAAESAADEAPPARASRPPTVAKPPSAEQQARVQDLLSGSRRK